MRDVGKNLVKGKTLYWAHSCIAYYLNNFCEHVGKEMMKDEINDASYVEKTTFEGNGKKYFRFCMWRKAWEVLLCRSLL